MSFFDYLRYYTRIRIYKISRLSPKRKFALLTSTTLLFLTVFILAYKETITSFILAGKVYSSAGDVTRSYNNVGFVIVLVAVFNAFLAIILILFRYLESPAIESTAQTQTLNEIIRPTTPIAQIASKEKIPTVHDLDYYSVRLRDRLRLEIARLSKTANLNLAIGAGITFLGLVYLAYTTANGVPIKKTEDFLTHYLPRLSLIIFVEVFAFFFLKIYKENLRDVKYYINELTNIEMQFIAIDIAEKQKKSESTTLVITRLLNTERNIILKTGESTLELEKDKISASSDKGIVDALKDIVSSKIKV